MFQGSQKVRDFLGKAEAHVALCRSGILANMLPNALQILDKTDRLTVGAIVAIHARFGREDVEVVRVVVTIVLSGRPIEAADLHAVDT